MMKSRMNSIISIITSLIVIACLFWMIIGAQCYEEKAEEACKPYIVESNRDIAVCITPEGYVVTKIRY